MMDLVEPSCVAQAMVQPGVPVTLGTGGSGWLGPQVATVSKK